MANYTTAAKVVKLLTGVASASVDTQFLDMVDNIINAKVGCRYTVPFTTVPPLIETIATDLVAYYVMRTLFTDDSQNKNEWIATYKETIKLLDRIAEGTVQLKDSSGNDISTITDALRSNVKDYHTTFDMDKIENSVIDDNLLDEIQDTKDN